jgi:hypothetical protein
MWDSVDTLEYARSLAKRDAQIHRSILAEARKYRLRTYCGVGDGVGEVASTAGDAADGFVKVAFAPGDVAEVASPPGDAADPAFILCSFSSICCLLLSL